MKKKCVKSDKVSSGAASDTKTINLIIINTLSCPVTYDPVAAPRDWTNKSAFGRIDFHFISPI